MTLLTCCSFHSLFVSSNFETTDWNQRSCSHFFKCINACEEMTQGSTSMVVALAAILLSVSAKNFHISASLVTNEWIFISGWITPLNISLLFEMIHMSGLLPLVVSLSLTKNVPRLFCKFKRSLSESRRVIFPKYHLPKRESEITNELLHIVRNSQQIEETSQDGILRPSLYYICL